MIVGSLFDVIDIFELSQSAAILSTVTVAVIKQLSLLLRVKEFMKMF
jgi:hypothetical protein